jgi:hypothetical protein
VPVESEIQRGGRGERGDPEHGVLEEAKSKDATRGVTLPRPRAPERRVVDREAAGRSRGREDTESADDGPQRLPEVHLRAVVDTRHVANGQDIAEIGGQLTREADPQPAPRVRRVDPPDEPLPARRRGQRE